MGQNKEQTTASAIWWLGGFYDYPIEGGIEITTDYWQVLLKGQECGQEITEDESGYPILREPAPPTAEALRQADIDELKTKLAATDWAVIKCAELGVSVADKYPGIYADREAGFHSIFLS